MQYSRYLTRAVAAGAAALFMLSPSHTDRANNMNHLMRLLYSAESPKAVSYAAKNVSRVMKKQGKKELAFNGKGVFQPVYVDARNVTVVSTDSQLAKQYTAVIGKEGDFVRDNVEWVIFSPNVRRENGDVDGLSIGAKAIMVDTVADDDSEKSSRTFPAVMAHEASHEHDGGLGVSRLEGERRANRRTINALSVQMAKDSDSAVVSAYNESRKRFETADFLSRFDDDFSNVYPKGVILSKDVLSAGVPPERVSHYKKMLEGKGGLEHELYLAAYFAEVALKEPRDNAIKLLYSFVRDRKNANTLAQVSAASALQFLAPGACKIESTAYGYSGTDRTAHLSFGSAKMPAKEKPSTYGVQNVPSLEEILSNKNFDDFEATSDASRPAVGRIIAEYKLYDGEALKSNTDANGVRYVYIPKQEGRPGPGFFRFYIKALDTDGNRRDDTLRVYYGTNKILLSDGSMLAKIDVYKSRRFAYSTLGRFATRERGRDLEFDINATWKEFRME